MPECINSNIHYHFLMYVADAERFEEYAPTIWEELVPSGQLHILKIQSVEDRAKVSAYVSKDLWQQENYDNTIILR